jgi:hypothetical protein
LSARRGPVDGSARKCANLPPFVGIRRRQRRFRVTDLQSRRIPAVHRRALATIRTF